MGVRQYVSDGVRSAKNYIKDGYNNMKTKVAAKFVSALIKAGVGIFVILLNPVTWVVIGALGLTLFTVSASETWGVQKFDSPPDFSTPPDLSRVDEKKRAEVTAQYFAQHGYSFEASAYLGVLLENNKEGFKYASQSIQPPSISASDLLSRIKNNDYGDNIQLGVWKIPRPYNEDMLAMAQNGELWDNSAIQFREMLSILNKLVAKDGSTLMKNGNTEHSIDEINSALSLSFTSKEKATLKEKTEELAKTVKKNFKSKAMGDGSEKGRTDGKGGNGSNDNNTAAMGSGRLGWPAKGPVTSEFGLRLHPIFNEWHGHAGIDIGVPLGTPVRAADDGKVVLAGSYGGYGLAVIVDHGGGLKTLYGHNSEIKCSKGDTVKKGDLVAISGSTGWSSGPHLHFEVQVNGKPVDPMGYLKD